MTNADTQKEVLAAEGRWLSAHRKEYAGKWIALQGDQLLAVAETSREIFNTVRHLKEPPLVMQINADDTPFGGW